MLNKILPVAAIAAAFAGQANAQTAAPAPAPAAAPGPAMKMVAPPPPAPAPAAAAAAPAPAASQAHPAGPMPKFVPPSKNPTMVQAGTYMVDTNHTQVLFSVLHFGFSNFYGQFSGVSGTLVVDPKKPANDQLDISVPMDSVYTTSAKLNGELKSPMWLDAGQFPTMTFKSTKITPTGKTTAKVMGDLTLHGVTKPVTLTATFLASGMNPIMGNVGLGFDVTGVIKRSEFGVGAYVPMISDDTKIMISAAFAK